MRTARFAGFVLLDLLVIGAVAGGVLWARQGDEAARRAEPRPSRLLERIPDVIQTNNYSCGVGVVQAVLARHGVWGYQDELARALGTSPEEGTHPARIVAYLHERGLEAELREGLTLADLRRFVDEGALAIVDFQAWNGGAGVDYAKEWEDGHYALLVGYGKDVFFLEDPSLLGTVGWVGAADLDARWHDYESEGGKRRDYVRSAIVVRGKGQPFPRFTHID